MKKSSSFYKTNKKLSLIQLLFYMLLMGAGLVVFLIRGDFELVAAALFLGISIIVTTVWIKDHYPDK